MPAQQKVVNAMELKDLVNRWETLNVTRERLAIEDSDAAAEIAMIKDQVYKRMTAMEAEKMTFPEGTVYFRAVSYPNILPGKEGEVIAWLDAQGPDGAAVAIREIKKGRLKEFLETQLEADAPLPPPELVEIKPQKTIQLKRTKGKSKTQQPQGDAL